LLVAGSLTTTDLIGNAVLAMLRHPEQLDKLRADPELVPNAVEEVLRYDPPVVQAGRRTLEPLEIGGTKVQAKEAMTVSLLAAGHDPARHADPHRFEIERADTSHLAFGGGAHFCLGAPLLAPKRRSPFPCCFSGSPACVSIRDMRSSVRPCRDSTG
jgi:cytochrome P450